MIVEMIFLGSVLRINPERGIALTVEILACSSNSVDVYLDLQAGGTNLKKRVKIDANNFKAAKDDGVTLSFERVVDLCSKLEPLTLNDHSKELIEFLVTKSLMRDLTATNQIVAQTSVICVLARCVSEQSEKKM